MFSNLTLYFTIVLSLIVHAVMLSLFYITPLSKTFNIPKMTRVSYLPMDMSQLGDYQDTSSEDVNNEEMLIGETSALPGDTVTSYLPYVRDSKDQFWSKEPSQIKETKGQVSAELKTQRKVVRLYYPHYPYWAKRAGWQSDVVLRFQILKNGEVGQLFFDQLSGYPELDALSLRAVRRWRFEALPDGVNEAQWGTVTLKFHLN